MTIKSIKLQIICMAIFGLLFINQAFTQQENMPGIQILTAANPIITLQYSDTILLPSFKEFDLPVLIKSGEEISAISLGFFFDTSYLEITGMVLADSVPGFYFSVEDSSFLMTWSRVNPIILSANDTLLTLNMKTLDISTLTGTLRLKINETSELADAEAISIEDAVLEIPQLGYFKPEPQDSIGNNSVSIYPNPFKESTTIYITLEKESDVKISLKNMAGIEIYTLADNIYPVGNHEIKIHGSDLSKGLYILKFEIRNSEIEGEKTLKVLKL